MRPWIFPEAERIVADHLAKGHIVAIVSGATRYIVEPMADHLGIAHTLCTRLEAVDGVLTGKVEEPVCLDEGKIHWVKELMRTEEIDLARSFFYTDSVTDLPLLDLVGHPVVTNPDPMLYAPRPFVAWPVRFFAPPSR